MNSGNVGRKPCKRELRDERERERPQTAQHPRQILPIPESPVSSGKHKAETERQEAREKMDGPSVVFLCVVSRVRERERSQQMLREPKAM